MEHTGIEEVNQTHQQQHEPISFGIDQILNSSDQSSGCMLPNRTGDPDYALASNVYSNGYNSVYNPACSMAAAAGLAGSYNVNMNMNVSMNMNVNVNSGGAGGVIRVPAHRPMPPPPPPGAAAPHPPPSTHPGIGPGIPSVPGMGMGNAANFTFPWMESSRRFAKDRLTGKTDLKFNVSHCFIAELELVHASQSNPLCFHVHFPPHCIQMKIDHIWHFLLCG